MFADLKRSGNSVPDIETFFSKPLQFLERTTKVLIAKPEIKNLFKKMLKNNGRVTIESLTDETERESFRQVTDELRGCYVKEMDDTFEFSNPSVHESVALAIGHLDPTFALEFLDEAFLLQKVIFDDLSETPKNGFLYMKPTDNVIKQLCIRLSPLLLRFDFSILQHDVCKRDDLCTQLLKMNVEVKRFGNHLKSFLKCKKETKIDINSRDRYGDTLLHVAHRGKNQAAIETLLTLGADVNVCNKRWGKEGLCYFELACTDKTIHKNLLIELVDRGAKLNRSLPNGDSVLHQLYHRGESQLFEYLLQKGANPNVLDAKRKTVLHYMCKDGGNVEDIEVLLNHRADVNKVKKSRNKYEEGIYKKEKIREKKGKTALHYLCTKECDIKVLRLLVKHGAKVNIQDLKGRTPLHYACGHKNLKVMKELLYYGSDVNAVDDAGNTPLHYLYDNGNTEGMELLLDKGADVNKTTGSDGKTLLHYECQRGQLNLDFLQLLLKYGSDVNKRRKKPHLPNRLGKTALHYLAKRDSAQTEPAVKLLMKHGADVNVRDGKGKTPLYFAFERKNDKIFSVLLDHNSDVNIADNNGMTVLQRTFEEAQTDVLKEILRLGTDVNKPDKVGKTLLHYICMREVRDLSLLDLLLQNGADVNKRKVYNLKQIESTDNISEKMHKVVKSFQDKGKTALHYACKFQSDFAVIEKLLNNGASVNVKDRHEMTPLHYLLANDDFALRDLQHLVRSGGDIQGINKNGHTGIHLLSTRRAVDYQILEYLIKCGVDCSRRDRDGRTALEYLGNSDETLQARELLDEHTRNS